MNHFSAVKCDFNPSARFEKSERFGGKEEMKFSQTNQNQAHSIHLLPFLCTLLLND